MIPLAWLAALLACHSAQQSFTVFCWASTGDDTVRSPAAAAHSTVTIDALTFISASSGGVNPSSPGQSFAGERCRQPKRGSLIAKSPA